MSQLVMKEALAAMQKDVGIRRSKPLVLGEVRGSFFISRLKYLRGVLSLLISNVCMDSLGSYHWIDLQGPFGFESI